MTSPLDVRARRTDSSRLPRPRRPSAANFGLRTLVLAVTVSLLLGIVLLAFGAASSGEEPGEFTAPAPAPAGESPSASEVATSPSGSAASPSRDEPSRVAKPVPPLEVEMRAYLGTRSTRAAVVVRDLLTDREYRYRSDARFDSASVVKVAILAAVLQRAQQQDRNLTAQERQLLGPMIRQSSNAATSTLWNTIGRGPGLEDFLATAGMSRTTAGPAGYWGLTRITAADQVLLMSHLTRSTGLLSEGRRRFALRLMGSVEEGQDWGVSAGPPAPRATVELKNGWLPRGADGWAVHSVGHVRGEGRDYLIAVLSTGSATREAGIDTVEGVSRLVWADLAPQRSRDR